MTAALIQLGPSRAECHPHPGGELVERKINFSLDLLLPYFSRLPYPLPCPQFHGKSECTSSNIPTPKHPPHSPRLGGVEMDDTNQFIWQVHATKGLASKMGRTLLVCTLLVCICPLVHLSAKISRKPCESSIIEQGWQDKSSVPPKSL